MENSPMNEQGTCASCGSGDCSGSCKGCSCPHHRAVPVFIILIAATFLLSAWDMLSESAVSVIWPILLGAIGITKMMKGKCKCC